MADREHTALEHPVPWTDIRSPPDDHEGVYFQEQYTTFPGGLRAYDGNLYVEEGDDEWMELKSWIQAVASGEIE